MKKVLLNFTVLTALVCCVYFSRRAFESDALPNDRNDDFRNGGYNARNLANSGYATEACSDVKNSSSLTELFQSMSQINSALFGTYRSTNYLEDNVLKAGISGSSAINYAMSFIPLVAPWLVLWILGIFLKCIFCCNQCCMVGCCKNCCQKCCKCCKKPKEDKKCYRILSLIIAVAASFGMLGISIAGLIFSSKLTDDYSNLNCAVFQGFGAFIYGNTTGKWTGVDGAYTTMAAVQQDFKTKFSDSYNPTADLATLDTQSNIYKNQLLTTYSTHNGKTVPSAQPSGGTAIKPDIIENLGDPLTTTTTWLGAIENERKAKYDLAKESANYIKESYDDIQSSVNTYSSDIDLAVDALDSLNIMFKDVESSGYSVTSKGKEIIKSYVYFALVGIFAGALAISVLTIVCPIAVCLCKKPCCNTMIFLAWEAFFWIAFIGFIIGIICLAIGIVLTQSCDVLYKTLDDRGFINNIVSWLNGADYIDYVNTCLFDDGDIIARLGVTSVFSSVNEILGNMTAVTSLFRVATVSSVFITELSTSLANTINGKYYLIADVSKTDGTLYNLNEMNKLSDYGLSGSTQTGCTASQDQWTINILNCTYSLVWAAGDSNTYSLGSQICIGIPSSIDSNARYTSGTMGSCATVSGQPIYTRLNNYRTAIKNQFDAGAGTSVLGSLQTDIDVTTKTNYQNFVEAIFDLTDPIQTLQTNIGAILTKIADPTTGLVYNLNCAFFRYGLRSIQSTMCSGLINSFLQLTTCVMLIALFGCVGSVHQFCFAKYMRTKLKKDKDEKEKQKKPAKYESELQHMNPSPDSQYQSPQYDARV